MTGIPQKACGFYQSAEATRVTAVLSAVLDAIRELLPGTKATVMLEVAPTDGCTHAHAAMGTVSGGLSLDAILDLHEEGE